MRQSKPWPSVLLGPLLLCSMLAGAQHAETQVAEASIADAAVDKLRVAPFTASPERLGYAFGQPRILVVQRLYGLAHGIALLAAACRELPDEALVEATRLAYHQWRTHQVATVLALQDELARWYFGREAARADRSDVVRALGLMPRLRQQGDELRPACASFPAALSQPRYDLQRLLRLEEALSQVAIGIRAEQTLAQCRERLTGEEREQLLRRHAVWLAAHGIRLTLWRELADALWLDEAQSFEQWQTARSQQEARTSRRDCLKASAALNSPASMLGAITPPEINILRPVSEVAIPADNSPTATSPPDLASDPPFAPPAPAEAKATEAVP